MGASEKLSAAADKQQPIPLLAVGKANNGCGSVGWRG